MVYWEKCLLVEFDDGICIDVCFSEEVLSFQLMCLCMLIVVNGWVYVQKVVGVCCCGDVCSVFGDYDLQVLDVFVYYDWLVGYMCLEIFWNWVCLFGEVDGLWVGLNLLCGVNEISFIENCYWLDGELLKVDSVCFDFDCDQLLWFWIICLYDGQVELCFEVYGMYQEWLNFGLLVSNFKQIFGCFSGVLCL